MVAQATFVRGGVADRPGVRTPRRSDTGPPGPEPGRVRPAPAKGAGGSATVLLIGETRGLVSRVAWSLPAELCDRHIVIGPGSLGLLRLAARCMGHLRIDLDDRGAAAFQSFAAALIGAGEVVVALAADEAGIRFLCRTPVEGMICAPHPGPAVVADFCDKSAFFATCKRLGVRTPNTVAYRDKAAIDCRAVASRFAYPLIVKPATGTMSIGVVKVQSEAELKASVIDNPVYDFGPVLLQDFIAGADIGISVFAIDGTILHHAVQMRNRHTIAFLRDETLLDATRVLMRDCSYTGLANIDARRDPHGDVYLLECNPRPWGSITAPTWCGLNFVRASLMFALGQPNDVPRSIADCSTPGAWQRVKSILRNPRTWNRLAADQKRTLESAAWLAIFDGQEAVARIADRVRFRQPHR